MRSTFHTLEIGKRGITAQQLSIATTGHNITNANTEGYSRQVARHVAARPIDYPGIYNNSKLPNQMGMGVEIESIKRVRDYLLDIEYQQPPRGRFSKRHCLILKVYSMNHLKTA